MGARCAVRGAAPHSTQISTSNLDPKEYSKSGVFKPTSYARIKTRRIENLLIVELAAAGRRRRRRVFTVCPASGIGMGIGVVAQHITRAQRP